MTKEKILNLPVLMLNCKMQIPWNSRISGIYAWVNEINGKMYIGQSVNFYKRVYDEMNGFRNNRHQNMFKLFNAINKYGMGHFRVIRLLESPQKYLNKLEQILIEYYDTHKNGYNCNIGGDGNGGHKVTAEQIQKQKRSLQQYWTPQKKQEQSEKMKKWFKDQSPESQQKMKDGNGWWEDTKIKKKHLENTLKSLTKKRIEKQRVSLNKYYSTNNGMMRYKKIVVLSPENKIKIVEHIPSFCKEHNLGRVGFYKFLKKETSDLFRGWKVISKET